MHRMRNQIADAVQHCTMACETRKAKEVLGHDRDRKVPTAGLAAGVSGVLGAVVLDIEHRRTELRESRLQRVGDAGGHGCTLTLAASSGHSVVNEAAALPPEGAQFASWDAPATLTVPAPTP